MAKAQAAMEYLMTYGWALLAIVIIVAVLMFINPFAAPDTCIFDGYALGCSNQRLVSQDSSSSATNVVYAKISNNQMKTIEIIGMACARGENIPRVGRDGNFESPAFQVPGEKPMLAYGNNINTGQMPEGIGTASSGKQFKLQCHNIDENGEIDTEFAFTQGEHFMGKIYIAYKYRGEGETMPPKISSGKFIGYVQ
ncbi:MAG: hypothetical protein ABIH83_04155 [Candidatus Micrarchaeota archaeon]